MLTLFPENAIKQCEGAQAPVYLSRGFGKAPRLSQAFVNLLVGGTGVGILSPGRGSPLAATPVPLELGQPPHSGVGLFPASKLGIGRGARQPSGSGFLGLEHIFPHPQQPCLNPTYKHRVLIPSWAQTFSPLSPLPPLPKD